MRTTSAGIGMPLIVIGCLMMIISKCSYTPNESQPSDELKICIIKANETQKNYVFKDGKCFVEAE